VSRPIIHVPPCCGEVLFPVFCLPSCYGKVSHLNIHVPPHGGKVSFPVFCSSQWGGEVLFPSPFQKTIVIPPPSARHWRLIVHRAFRDERRRRSNKLPGHVSPLRRKLLETAPKWRQIHRPI